MSDHYEVLITKDNEATALNLRKALELRGLRATHSSTFNSAKHLVEQRRFDIAFVDLDLEKEGAGYDRLPLSSYCDTYPAIISCHDEDDYIERGYDSACGDYIVKPFIKEKLDRIFTKVKGLGSVNYFLSRIEKEFHRCTTSPKTACRPLNLARNATAGNRVPSDSGESYRCYWINADSHSHHGVAIICL
jgi:DNA-binding NtrC family response regulator